jgi:hypothetical protein
MEMYRRLAHPAAPSGAITRTEGPKASYMRLS